MKKNKIQKNTLRDYILRGTSKEYSKQTITGLFRSIVETVLEASSQESLVLYKIFDTQGLSSVLKRLEFSNSTMYSFFDNPEFENIKNIEKKDVWYDVQFLMVLAPRYSVVLMWDYSILDDENMSEICLVYNSKIVADIAKVIFENSTIKLDEYLTTYAPDRRENDLLNIAINKLVDNFNSVNEEIVLQQAEKENLEKSEELLQEFEYTSDNAKFVSHEIKNHLSVINLYTKIAEKRLAKIELKKEDKESIDNSIESIRNAAYSITQFVDELKTHAKPIMTEKKLKTVLEDVFKLTIPKAKDSQVELNIVLKEDFRIHVDEVKIQSVLINLIYNAIEATDKKGKVTIKCEGKKDNFAQIIISDTGCGISDKHKDLIFDEGFTTKLTGNGLGLRICTMLMQEQFGDLRLLKSDKNGTDMEVLIPIR